LEAKRGSKHRIAPRTLGFQRRLPFSNIGKTLQDGWETKGGGDDLAMANRVTIGERLRYAFDKSMSAGPIALIGWLALISLVVIVFASLILVLFQVGPEGQPPVDFFEAIWESLMRSMDAGTVAGDTGWGFRLIGLLVTIAGIFIFSTLIGVLSSGIEGKLDELRKGRSRVLEEDHTIILNWSPTIFDVVSELVVANASRKKPRVVIMANRDKVEMEDEIADKVQDLGNTRVICRSGDPTDLYDLSLVSPDKARSIIVLSPEGEDPDAQVIKTVLALIHDPRRPKGRYQIAAEIRDARNKSLAQVVGGDEVQLVLADDLIARIMVHSSRQSGLSAVYAELLDFDGCEIYTLPQPGLVGKSFGDAVMAYETSTLIGLCDAEGRVSLNPDMNSQVKEGMRAIIVAEDDSAIKLAPDRAAIAADLVRTPPKKEPASERFLMLGWNRRAPIIAYELSRYVAPGSVLTIAADTPTLEADVGNLVVGSDNLAVEFGVIDTSNRTILEGLDVPSYNHVLVMGYSDLMAPQQTDTRTLVTLLHLRKIGESVGRRINVVSEMIDVRNRELAEVTGADDFVVSNRLVSLMLAQASENDKIAAIFDDLLDEAGSEIYMRPIEDYVALEQPVSFYTLADAARQRSEVAMGYMRGRSPNGTGGSVVVNPKKSEALTYAPGDRLIVLAKD
jgi:ion channel POLLUX/CASTOR